MPRLFSKQEANESALHRILSQKEDVSRKLDNARSRDKQAEIIREHIMSNVHTVKMSCADYDLYWLYSRKQKTNIVLLQLAVFKHGGKMDITIQGASACFLSTNNRIDFYNNPKEFLELFRKAF